MQRIGGEIEIDDQTICHNNVFERASQFQYYHKMHKFLCSVDTARGRLQIQQDYPDYIINNCHTNSAGVSFI